MNVSSKWVGDLTREHLARRVGGRDGHDQGRDSDEAAKEYGAKWR